MGNSDIPKHTAVRIKKLAPACIALAALTACDDFSEFSFANPFGSQPETAAEGTQTTVEQEFLEQDVEMPEIFSTQETALWDGRPSLGGVWIAHPDVGDPERAMIRNQENGKFVVGALFRRERDLPGPNLQLSSEAAQALDVLAGSPVEMSVVVLRKERVPVAPPEAEVLVEALDAPGDIEQTQLDPIAAAGAAIEAADPTPVTDAAVTQTPSVESSLPVSRLDKPYIQVGIYSVERNANAVTNQMRSAGMVPTVRVSTRDGKSSWRVIVGPAKDQEERAVLLTKIKAEGYSDAFPVRD